MITRSNFPTKVEFLISDIDGVLTTENKKAIAPGIEQRLSEIKKHGITIIANTLRGTAKYGKVINGTMQEIIDYGISERGAIQINKQGNIIPLISKEDQQAVQSFDKQIKNILTNKGATLGPGPYNCIKYYFADNEICSNIVKEMEDEPIYMNRENDLMLEATGQGSIILTKNNVDKGYGILKSIGSENFDKTIVLGDDIVDETMFLLPDIYSFNVGHDKTLRSKYTTNNTGYQATIEILDALIEILQ